MNKIFVLLSILVLSGCSFSINTNNLSHTKWDVICTDMGSPVIMVEAADDARIANNVTYIEKDGAELRYTGNCLLARKEIK